MEQNINLLDSFYQPYLNDKEIYQSSANKILNENKIDDFELLKLDKDPDAGEIKLDYKDDKEKEVDGYNFLEGAWNFAASLPRDTVFSLMHGGLNAAELGINFVPLLDKLASFDPNYKPNSDLTDKVESWKKNIGNLETYLDKEQANSEMQSKASEFVAFMFQEAPFAVPIYRKLKKMKVPNAYAVPLSFGIGGAIAYDEKFSLFLNTENMKNFKTLIKIAPDTPEEVLYDNVYQAFEGTLLAGLIPAVWKGLKFAKRNFPKAETVSELAKLGAASGLFYKAVTSKAQSDNIGNNTIPKQTNNK